MWSEKIRNVAENLRNAGKSYNEIATILNISKQSARNLCLYKPKSIKKKTGPKDKINGFTSYRIRREVNNLKKSEQKVTTTKIIQNCKLDI